MMQIRALMRAAMLATACCALLAGCKADPVAALNQRIADTGSVNDHSGNSLLRLADRFAAAGDHKAAIPLYRRASASLSITRAESVEPLLGLARSLAATGALDAAEATLEKAADRNGEDPRVHAMLGNILLMKGQTARAMPEIYRALALDPASPEALRGMASIYDLTGRHAEALATYQQILAADPADARTLNNYGLSLALNGAPDQGIRVLKQALKSPGAGAAQRQNLALAYLLQGQESEARKLVSIDSGQASADHGLRALYTVAALKPADRLAALVQGSGETAFKPVAPEGLNARQVAALRVISADPVTVAALPAPASEAAARKTPAIRTSEIKTAPPPRQSAPNHRAEAVWTVQLAAYRRDSQLKHGWSILSARYADLLKGLTPQQAEIDFGTDGAGPNGVYYRLNAGPLPGEAAAKALCAKIQTLGGACIVRSGTPAPLQIASAD